jgi:tetratricopeptide (TPR) repeat protein
MVNQLYWIELVENSGIYEINKTYKWPMDDSIELELLTKTKIQKVVNDFISPLDPVNYFHLHIDEFELHLDFIDFGTHHVYRGSIIPLEFVNLRLIMGEIFKNWDSRVTDFGDWISKFHGLRMNFNYLKYYQTREAIIVRLPPSWIVNDTKLLDVLSNIVLSNLDSSINRYNLFLLIHKSLPEDITKLITNIPGEMDIIALNVIEHIFSDADTGIDLIYPLYDLGREIHSQYCELIFINYFYKLIDNGQAVDIKAIDDINKILSHSQISIIIVSALKLMGKYYLSTHQLNKSVEYYQQLINKAPELSWFPNQDILYSYLELGKLSQLRGNYVDAYSFNIITRKFITAIRNQQLIAENELQLEKNLVLATTQVLNAGIYQYNFGIRDHVTISMILDGFHYAINLITRHHLVNRQLVNFMLEPLVTTGLNILYMERDSDLINMDNAFIKSLEESINNLLVADPEIKAIDNGTLLANELMMKINEGNQIISLISVFFQDGRHIGDIRLVDDRFTIKSTGEEMLYSSALASVNMFLQEATQSSSAINEIAIGSRKIIFEKGTYVMVAIHAKRSEPFVRTRILEAILEFEKDFQQDLHMWSGDTSIFANFHEYFKMLKPYFI